MNVSDPLTDVLGGPGRCLGQSLDLVGDDCKALARLTGSRSKPVIPYGVTVSVGSAGVGSTDHDEPL